MSNVSYKNRAEGIAKELQATVVRYAEVGFAEWYVISLPAGESIHLHFDGYAQRNRLQVSGSWPKSARNGSTTGVSPRDCGAIGYGETPPEITVSLSKSDKQIAADITRRFLPDFLPVYAKCLEYVQRTDKYDADRASIAQEFSSFGQVLVDTQAISLRLDGDTWGNVESIDPTGMTCTLKLHGVPLGVARKILILLKG